MTDIFENMKLKKYLDMPGLTHRVLGAMRQSPAHCKWEVENKSDDPTPTMALGSAVHAWALNSGEDIGVLPQDLDRRTKDGKIAYAEFLMAHEGGTIISYEQSLTAQAMVESLKKFKPFISLASKAKVEMSAFWKWQDIVCKGRIDAYNQELKTLIDLKTATRADYGFFSKQVFDLGYYRQVAWYKGGIKNLYPVEHCVFIAVENTPPYACACYRLDDQALALAEMENEDLLTKYKACSDTGQWSAYPDFVQDIKLPEWASTKLQETYGNN